MDRNFKIILLLILVVFKLSESLPEWKDHEISTLKLLQIVHRHGERSPLKTSVPKTDPYSDETKYWPQGFDQLTNKGKYRMYKIGQYIRDNYNGFLSHSKREVYVRSSIVHRCLESVACLMAGAYPPVNQWQWNVGSDSELGLHWQPIPIETFMPKNEDPMLVPDKKCPNAERELAKILNSKTVKDILENYQKTNISREINYYINDTIKTLSRAVQIWDTLNIELENKYIWKEMGEEKQKHIVEVLKELTRMAFAYDTNSTLIRRAKVGELVRSLTENMDKIVRNTTVSDNNYKLYVYSTHDSIIAPLLQAFNISNNLLPTYGSSVILELHQNLNKTSNNYFVKYYYFNETFTSQPFLMKTENFDILYKNAKNQLFVNNFNELCGIRSENLLLAEMTFLTIGIGIGISVFGLLLTLFLLIKKKRSLSMYSVNSKYKMKNDF